MNISNAGIALNSPSIPSPVNRRPAYLQHLKQDEFITLNCGAPCAVWNLDIPDEESYLSEWAARFRQTYCSEADLDPLRDGTGKSRREYLLDVIFPDERISPGPAIRAGDFAELLISDFVEFMLNYWVPRDKYAEKGSRNESVKGVDIIGFKCFDAKRPMPSDSMLTFEVKAQLSGGKYNEKLQVAVNDSGKDYLRAGETLAAMKRRMYLRKDIGQVMVVQRFQNAVDSPYELLSGAAAILSDDAFSIEGIKATTTSNHSNLEKLQIVVIRGTNLMALAHALYQRAADEA